MIDKIKCPTRIANDVHKELIHMWNALRGGWTPPEYISESEYKNVKENKDKYPSYYVGYVGFHSTFGGKYFGGYARSFKSDGITPELIQMKEAEARLQHGWVTVQGANTVVANE